MFKKYFKYILVLTLIVSILPMPNITQAESTYSEKVMFIHGYNSSPKRWKENAEVYRNLKSKFGDKNVYAVDYVEYSRNDISTEEVQDRIEEGFKYLIKNSKSDEKVDIIVHSMGGLAIRWFLLENQEYVDNVGKVIFLDTPNHGSHVSFAARISAMIQNPEDYDINPSTVVKYRNLYKEYRKDIFSLFKRDKVISFEEWLAQNEPQTIENLVNSQHDKAGKSEKLFNGTVGVKVGDTSERYRYSKAFEEFASIQIAKYEEKMNSLERFDKDEYLWLLYRNSVDDFVFATEVYGLVPTESLSSLINLNFEDSYEEYLKKMDANAREDKVTAKNIVQDRLISEYFYLPTSVGKDGKVEKTQILSNPFLYKLNKEEHDYRLKRFMNQEYIPTYITIASYDDSSMANLISRISDLGVSKNPFERHDWVVPLSSVSLPKVFLDREVVAKNEITHLNIPSETGLIEKYFYNPINAVENWGSPSDEELLYSLQDSINSEVVAPDKSVIFLKNDVTDKKNVAFKIKTYTNDRLAVIKRDKNGNWLDITKLRPQFNSSNSYHTLYATKLDNNVEDFMIVSLDFLGVRKNSGTFDLDFKLGKETSDSTDIDTNEYSYFIDKVSTEEGKHTITHKLKVYDINGDSVDNLKAKDFIVKDGNNIVDTLRVNVTKKEIEAKDNVMLALDYSNSMREGYAFERSLNSAEQYLGSLDKDINLGLIGFADGVHKLQSFTTDYKGASRKLFTNIGGGTALNDTIVTATNSLASQEGNRILILMTDGEDDGSSNSLEQAIALAKQRNVTIYVIALGGHLSLDVLHQITSATGGKVFLSYNPDELDDIYGEITTITEYTYEISYIIPNGSKSDRDILISLSNDRSKEAEFGVKEGNSNE